MIGFTSTSLRKNSISEVAEAAYRASAEIIEWGSDVHVKTLSDAYEAKRLCDDKGIIINSYGTYYRIGGKNAEEWERICEISAAMGAKYIRTWLGEKGSAHTSENEYALILSHARDMAKTAGKYGLVISNECHPHTYNDTTASSLRFLNDIGCDNVRTYYQSWYRGEKGDREKLEKTFPFVTDVHLSFSEMEKFQLLHKKDEDYIEKILSWLNSLGFENGLLIEFTKHSDAENLIKDIERLRLIWENVKRK